MVIVQWQTDGQITVQTADHGASSCRFVTHLGFTCQQNCDDQTKQPNSTAKDFHNQDLHKGKVGLKVIK